MEGSSDTYLVDNSHILAPILCVQFFTHNLGVELKFWERMATAN